MGLNTRVCVRGAIVLCSVAFAVPVGAPRSEGPAAASPVPTASGTGAAAFAQTAKGSLAQQAAQDEDKDQQGEKSNGSDTGNAWLIALVGALAGALITLLGDRGWSTFQEKRSLTILLQYLYKEIALIERQARARAARGPSDPFPFDPPLPTNAWTLLGESEVAWRLVKEEKIFASLTELYDSVEDSIHKNQVAANIFALVQSGTSDDEEARILFDKAMRLTIEPYGDVGPKAQAALRALKSRSGAS